MSCAINSIEGGRESWYHYYALVRAVSCWVRTHFDGRWVGAVRLHRAKAAAAAAARAVAAVGVGVAVDARRRTLGEEGCSAGARGGERVEVHRNITRRRVGRKGWWQESEHRRLLRRGEVHRVEEQTGQKSVASTEEI